MPSTADSIGRSQRTIVAFASGDTCLDVGIVCRVADQKRLASCALVKPDRLVHQSPDVEERYQRHKNPKQNSDDDCVHRT